MSFELRGERLALSGPSGAGKTRLLRAMADLDAHGGVCMLDDRPAEQFEAPAWRRRVSYLAAESAWWADTPRAHLPPADDRMHARIESLALSADLLDMPLSRLSSGQRQRMALLRLLAFDPEVLLLDEPTANLDADNVARVEGLIVNYCERRNACAIWVGHDIDQLKRVTCRRVTLDDTGRPVG